MLLAMRPPRHIGPALALSDEQCVRRKQVLIEVAMSSAWYQAKVTCPQRLQVDLLCSGQMGVSVRPSADLRPSSTLVGGESESSGCSFDGVAPPHPAFVRQLLNLVLENEGSTGFFFIRFHRW